jgi:hypothetical protein
MTFAKQEDLKSEGCPDPRHLRGSTGSDIGIVGAQVDGKQSQPMTLFGTCSFFVHPAVEFPKLLSARLLVCDRERADCVLAALSEHRSRVPASCTVAAARRFELGCPACVDVVVFTRLSCGSREGRFCCGLWQVSRDGRTSETEKVYRYNGTDITLTNPCAQTLAEITEDRS